MKRKPKEIDMSPVKLFLFSLPLYSKSNIYTVKLNPKRLTLDLVPNLHYNLALKIFIRKPQCASS
jgi:hypothetical protein